MQSALLGNIYVITKNNYQGMFWAGKKKKCSQITSWDKPGDTFPANLCHIKTVFRLILLLARTRLHKVYVQGRRR